MAESSKAQYDFLDGCKSEVIGLPCDGESYSDDTLEEFKARLLELRRVGYIFPDGVLEDIDNEIKEQTNEPRD